ncbi:FG-GAP-like repeat-containing protein [Streptomyces sp. JH14]|uniref:FG-GAP-like repeat-containing protein n=1 Tax=Streptomyces sp. JH14 TaxID=2793630 RepID=UPI0023F96BA8|nr:FG-GAP-like repeat-containing protein [Streptomyces sp. JH14]MDF6043404.1 FG-GAP-like repeat-containing protein [Streptomyces sp. JH14]
MTSVRKGLLAPLLAAAVGGAVLLPLSTGAAQAETPAAEVVLDNPSQDQPRLMQLLSAGTTGFLHRQAGRDAEGLLWTPYDGGKTVSVQDSAGVYHMPQSIGRCFSIPSLCPDGVFGLGGDTVAMPSLRQSPVQLRDVTTNALRIVDGYQGPYQGTFGDVAIFGYIRGEFELIDAVDGEQRIRDVSGIPDGISNVVVTTGDARGAVVRWQREDGVYVLGYVDFAMATVAEIFVTDLGTEAWTVPETLLDRDRVGWIAPDSVVHLKSRSNLGGQETVRTLAGTSGDRHEAVLVGNWLVLAQSEASGPIVALPLDGGPAKVLLAKAGQGVQPAPDGSALVMGGTGNTDWWVQRITQDPQGALALTKVYKVAPYEALKGGLAFSRGQLRVAYGTSGTFDTNVWDLGTSGDPVPGKPIAGDAIGAAGEIWGNHHTGGDIVLAHSFVDQNVESDVAHSLGDGVVTADVEFGPGTDGGTLVDVADRFVVYNSGGPTPKQYVGEVGRGVQLTGPVRAAALAGRTLWRSTTTAGQVTSYDLRASKTTSTVSVGAPCIPAELQAAGKWLYWSCGSTGPAGVYDTVAKKSVAVNGGDVLLGDGFTVRHDHSDGKLLLTDVTGGASATRTLASFPDKGRATDRRYSWAVDEYTGMVAYTGELDQVHVLGTNTAHSALASVDRDVWDGIYLREPGYETWFGSWHLSRPVDSWTVTVRDTAGRTLRTLTGRDTRAVIQARWNGRTDSGAYAPNGRFSYSVDAVPAGGGASVRLATGTAMLGDGAAVFRDYSGGWGRPDGFGDLLAFTSAGVADFRGGTGTGSVSSKVSGSGWTGANTVTSAVPFDDVSGDRCNDVLVRVSSGELRAYKPSCGGALKSTTAYTKVGGGWNVYDALTSPGDLTGDGRADLLARETSTGYLYLYTSKGTGAFNARVKIGTGWKGYLLAGAGDLNGDGKGDLLARDSAGVLWRYAGTGTGTLATRVKVGGGWQIYNALVGVGDVSGDGKADLLARDTSGVLWSYRGDGKGLFAARTKVGGGWQMYSRLS